MPTLSRLLAVLILLCAFCLPCHAAPQLDASVDQNLQKGLDGCLLRLGLEEPCRRQELSVALVDVTDSSKPRLAMVNGQKMMYAASLPKIAILLAAFDRIDKGELKLDDATRQTLTDMIRRSSNTAATAMYNKVGPDHIIEVLTSERYKLYDRDHGGLWVGKPYGSGGAYKRDPLANLSHGATAFQVARFYYLLETGQLVSPEACRQMKDILSRPAINHKFVAGLAARNNVEMYRKSGTWANFHADSALVEHDGRKYIAVGLSTNPSGGQWLVNLIRGLDDVITKG